MSFARNVIMITGAFNSLMMMGIVAGNAIYDNSPLDFDHNGKNDLHEWVSEVNESASEESVLAVD